MKNQPKKSLIKAERENRERRIEPGGIKTAWDNSNPEHVQAVGYEDFDYDAVDKNLGCKEPKLEKSAIEADDVESELRGAEALVILTAWQLEPYSRDEIINGVKRNITMRTQLSAYCKTLCVQLVLRPEFLGENPSLDSIAIYAKISKQVLARVFGDLKDRFPLFISRRMRSPIVCELYRQAQLARLEVCPDGEFHAQISLFDIPEAVEDSPTNFTDVTQLEFML